MNDPLKKLFVETPTQLLTHPPTLAAWWRDNQGAERWRNMHKSILGDLVEEATRCATAEERERCARECDEVEQSWIDEATAVLESGRLSGDYLNCAAVAGGCAAAIREEADDE